MADPLAALSPEALAAFYRRIAEYALQLNDAARRGDRAYVAAPMAPAMLLRWLGNRDTSTVLAVDAPVHLLRSAKLAAALAFHRRVFLTEEKARVGSRENPVHRWAGVVPRLQGTLGFDRWVPGTTVTMEYESNVDFGPNEVEVRWIQCFGTPDERDLLTSLKGWRLTSRVSATAALLGATRACVRFTSWVCSGTDYYDFSKVLGFTLPNPDYGSKEAGAIAPDEKSVRVEHTNAIRLEEARLACPYHVQVKPWQPSDDALKEPAEVDLSRRL